MNQIEAENGTRPGQRTGSKPLSPNRTATSRREKDSNGLACERTTELL
jgi:hypothetical protein